MSELGSLYIKLGEPEGELCGCTCEVGDWAAKHIVDLTEQRDKLLAALMESSLQNGSIDAGERNALYDEAGKLFRMAHELVGVAVMVYGE